jgi:hypothetical protein
MAFQFTHMESGEAMPAMEDAPISHWDAVMRAARLTRAQVRGSAGGALG